MSNGWKTTEQTDLWMNHYLESDYCLTTVQIATASRFPSLTQYPWTCALRDQELGVCRKNA